MNPKILTVDDSKIVRIMVRRALAPFCCEIVEAANGVDGLAAAARERPALVLLDVTMPVLDGMAMLAQLRGTAELKAIPVIMLTAESAGENIARADGLGISGYIAKPFTEPLLAETVRRILPLVARAA